MVVLRRIVVVKSFLTWEQRVLINRRIEMTPNGFETELDELLWDVVEAKCQLSMSDNEQRILDVITAYGGELKAQKNFYDDDDDLDCDAWFLHTEEQWSIHVDGPTKDKDDDWCFEHYSQVLVNLTG
jgi:hypothetical protein